MVFDAGKTTLETFHRAGLPASLAPHAPYSCSRELIRLIMDHCRQHQLPSSIHNQESMAENEFFLHKTGDYLRLYEILGLPLDHFAASGKSSLQSILDALNEEVNTLLVHNTFSSRNDVEISRKALNHLYWCLCPNANLYIENTLPDAELLHVSGCALTLGTDSLASNAELSILQEIMTLQAHFPNISLEALLKAATSNGAAFLGIGDKYGSLEKGKAPGIILIDPEKGAVNVLA